MLSFEWVRRPASAVAPRRVRGSVLGLAFVLPVAAAVLAMGPAHAAPASAPGLAQTVDQLNQSLASDVIEVRRGRGFRGGHFRAGRSFRSYRTVRHYHRGGYGRRHYGYKPYRYRYAKHYYHRPYRRYYRPYVVYGGYGIYNYNSCYLPCRAEGYSRRYCRYHCATNSYW
ncbi:MAG: hypothetical protein NW205_12265 [Hyphomicrobiaceae bacterium]|nr:hypothetical protein [Hyphomicrobiaceae bacterium]